MSRLHVDRLFRIEHAPDGRGWLATCRLCPPPLDRVPFRERTWDDAAAQLGEHVERTHVGQAQGRAA